VSVPRWRHTAQDVTRSIPRNTVLGVWSLLSQSQSSCRTPNTGVVSHHLAQRRDNGAISRLATFGRSPSTPFTARCASASAQRRGVIVSRCVVEINRNKPTTAGAARWKRDVKTATVVSDTSRATSYRLSASATRPRSCDSVLHLNRI